MPSDARRATLAQKFPRRAAAAMRGLAALIVLLAAVAVHAQSNLDRLRSTPGVVAADFIFTDAPFAFAHASTIEQTTEGSLVSSWFGGSHEGKPDVTIWVSRQEDGAWTPPVEVARGAADDGTPLPCWNPVLFQYPDGPLLLFYKVGPRPRSWWGMVTHSRDGGRTWSSPIRLPDGYIGPVKNKPVLAPDGRLVMPSSTEHDGWRLHLEFVGSIDRMFAGDTDTWSRTSPLNDAKGPQVIQPSVMVHPDGRMHLLARTRKDQKLAEAWSRDGGRTWSAVTMTAMPNNNSGTDAVMLADGTTLLVYNHTDVIGRSHRSPLNVAVSSDGAAWRACLELENEPGEYSYPAVVVSHDGLVHVTYTWRTARIMHVTLDPDRLMSQPIVAGRWPAFTNAQR